MKYVRVSSKSCMTRTDERVFKEYIVTFEIWENEQRPYIQNWTENQQFRGESLYLNVVSVIYVYQNCFLATGYIYALCPGKRNPQQNR